MFSPLKAPHYGFYTFGCGILFGLPSFPFFFSCSLVRCLSFIYLIIYFLPTIFRTLKENLLLFYWKKLGEADCPTLTKGIEFWKGATFWNHSIPMGCSQRHPNGTFTKVECGHLYSSGQIHRPPNYFQRHSPWGQNIIHNLQAHRQQKLDNCQHIHHSHLKWTGIDVEVAKRGQLQHCPRHHRRWLQSPRRNRSKRERRGTCHAKKRSDLLAPYEILVQANRCLEIGQLLKNV